MKKDFSLFVLFTVFAGLYAYFDYPWVVFLNALTAGTYLMDGLNKLVLSSQSLADTLKRECEQMQTEFYEQALQSAGYSPLEEQMASCCIQVVQRETSFTSSPLKGLGLFDRCMFRWTLLTQTESTLNRLAGTHARQIVWALRSELSRNI